MSHARVALQLSACASKVWSAPSALDSGASRRHRLYVAVHSFCLPSAWASHPQGIAFGCTMSGLCRDGNTIGLVLEQRTVARPKALCSVEAVSSEAPVLRPSSTSSAPPELKSTPLDAPSKSKSLQGRPIAIAGPRAQRKGSKTTLPFCVSSAPTVSPRPREQLRLADCRSGFLILQI